MTLPLNVFNVWFQINSYGTYKCASPMWKY